MSIARPDTQPVLTRLVDKISKPRFFTISLGLHPVIILVLGGTVMAGVIQEPAEFVADGGEFVSRNDDLGRGRSGNWVATNPVIWENRAAYLNNVTEDSVRQSYEFGINVVVHLLTRWEKKLKSPTML